jgi:hypothetical protein
MVYPTDDRDKAFLGLGQRTSLKYSLTFTLIFRYNMKVIPVQQYTLRDSKLYTYCYLSFTLVGTVVVQVNFYS